MNIKKIIQEVIKLPIKVGDTVYMGKFKNKKTVIKTIDWNDKGDLMINGKSALRMRIPKKAKLKESDFDWADEVNTLDHVVGKAFQFNPPIGQGSNAEDYHVLWKYFTELGGTPINDTPKHTKEAVGIYFGLNSDGDPIFVYTDYIYEDDEAESYKEHIEDFLEKTVEVVDAKEFIEEMGL